MSQDIGTRPDAPAARRSGSAAQHWSVRLTRGHGRGVKAGVWLVPAVVVAAVVVGVLLRWWLR